MDAISDNIDTNADYALLYTYYINLEAVSFLEEFKDGLSKSESNYSQRIKEFRKITSPVLKRINNWTDLEKFRSSIIAHPWRDKKGKFIVLNQGYFNVPRNWFEVAVLLNLMSYLWALVTAEFGKELYDALQYIATLQTIPKPSNDYSNLNSDHLKMAEEVANQSKLFNRNYSLKVLLYDLVQGEK